jgi:hypothetical protein
MIITGFNPQIITKDPHAVIATLEALGFERTHNKSGDDEFEFSSVRMKRMKDGSETEAFRIDVISAPSNGLDRDLTCIRINVDDFDSACELMKRNGARQSDKFGKNETPSSKYAYFVLPSGMIVDVCQHIKKNEE